MTTKKLKISTPKKALIASTGLIALSVNADGSYDHNSESDLKIESLERISKGMYKIVLKSGLRELITHVTPLVKSHCQHIVAQTIHETCACGKSRIIYVQTSALNCRLRNCSFDIMIVLIAAQCAADTAALKQESIHT
jgi:hypothetical protein